ncbi:CLIP-associated protein [Corchorus olitorius]|uniref:CLIP-associated protein n=1 Tax=Corchorus olitorius TaxID=93759 RepID=A0A1R3IJB3_9ROSI|nr:CLIP-associated protein [Corchorus olitorius]
MLMVLGGITQILIEVQGIIRTLRGLRLNYQQSTRKEASTSRIRTEPKTVSVELVNDVPVELVNEASMEEVSDEDDNSNNEIEMAVQIPEEDMRWLARSVIVLLHNTDGKKDLVSLINKLDPTVLVRDFSNIMILLTVEEDQSLNDCINALSVEVIPKSQEALEIAKAIDDRRLESFDEDLVEDNLIHASFGSSVRPRDTLE